MDSLCSQNDEQIDKLAKQLTSNVDEQNKFKNAISDKKSKLKKSGDNKFGQKEDKKEDDEVEQIYIKTLTGKTLSLTITTNMNIKNIKEQIEEKKVFHKNNRNWYL